MLGSRKEVFSGMFEGNRGYYMAARRYEISVRVLKYFSTREEKFRISKRPRNVLFIIETPMKYQIISLSLRKARFIM